jgi:plastocyanin
LKEDYYSKNLTIKKLSKFFFLLFLSVGIFFSVSLIPESFAANANLFVSAENSQFDNYMSGPQVIEVVVIDSDINDTDEAKGEPDVTVNGKILRMVQAVDGNWYGYFADATMAQFADNSTSVLGAGLDFGVICTGGNLTSAESFVNIDFSDTNGVAIGATSCEGTGPPTQNVLREAKDINAEQPTTTGLGGQIGVNIDAWPFIQLYTLNPTGNVVIQYNKGGGAQTTTLTFDTVSQFANIELDKPLYKVDSNVLLTITDLWLNIDPTDEDSWTFGTFGNVSANYQVFDENGNQAGDANNGVFDITSITSNLMCDNNCILTTNPDVQSTGFVITLQDNEDSVLINVDGDSDFSIDPQNPLDWGTGGGHLNGTIPITITEHGPNSGIFGSFDELTRSNIVVTNDAMVASEATIVYNGIETTIIASSTDQLVIFEEGSSSSSCNPCITPSKVTILQNQNVTWVNSDVAAHVVTSGNPTDGPDGIFDSGFIFPGESFDFTFNSAGIFDYYDIIHPWITGEIQVTDLTPPTDTDVLIDFDGHDTNCQTTEDCFEPQSLSVNVGTTVKWFNSDIIDHRITSGAPEGGSDGKFDSGTLSPGQEFQHNFNEVGTFPYFDPLHTWAIGEIVVNPIFPPGVDIIIAPGSSAPGCENTDTCFITSNFNANLGDTITWNNTDNAGHTITSGTPGGGPDGNFDSGLMSPNQEFSHQFNQDGIFPYYDLLHPWMIGSITIAPQDCQVPPNGNWTINQNCKLTSNNTTPANVRVENNSTLTIQSGITLTIPSGQNITIESGSGVLIESGGNLNVLS